MFFSQTKRTDSRTILTNEAKSSPRSNLRSLLGGAALAALLLVPSLSPALAQQPATPPSFNPDAVVFSVDGKDYTNRDLAFASVDFQRDLERVPLESRREALIEIMINMLVLAKQARKDKLDVTPEYQRILALLEARALRNLYVRKVIHPQVTDALSQERYVELLARFEPQNQIRARHILMKTKEEAEAIIKELDAGKDFAELAKEKSGGPSAENGGDLGFFTGDQMVPAFQDAASKLEAGKYSKEPVETQFGWHVIKVEEIRKEPAPTYEEAQAQIQEQLFGEAFQKKIDELRKQAKINVVVESAPKAAEGAAATPTAPVPVEKKPK
ncbi:MAG: peptidylprolyl isomerase [Rhizobiales bacterium]|nr:peptidylprolyl isomerase [Hyphomicrobiales bacterium]